MPCELLKLFHHPVNTVSSVEFYMHFFCVSDDNVSFLAYGSSSTNSNSVLTFPSIISNRGNGYNSSTGRFTCRCPGIYNFVVTLTKPKQTRYSACILINGAEKLRLNSYSSDFDVRSFSLGGNFHLNTNDSVYVYSSTKVFQNDCSTSFTGILVKPDN